MSGSSVQPVLAPASVSLEVLSNGTCQMDVPCLILRTTHSVYLINCPEGTSRFMRGLWLRSATINDVLLTNPAWHNIAGISALMMDRADGGATRVHGSVGLRPFLECIRPFQDSDQYVRFNTLLEEQSYKNGGYEDAALKINYIPLPPDRDATLALAGVPLVAYLLELKKPPRRIDIGKMRQIGIPPGPMIGKLKAGETVTLPDGRSISPTDVLSDEADEQSGRILIGEYPTVEHVSAMMASLTFRDVQKSALQIGHAVHIAPVDVIDSKEFAELRRQLGSKCKNIVFDGRSPVVPHIDSIHVNQHLLRQVSPRLFPAISPANWHGFVTHTGLHSGVEPEKGEEGLGQLVRPAPLHRWDLRGLVPVELPSYDVRLTDILSRVEDSDEDRAAIREELEKYWEEFGKTETEEDGKEFPRVSFLGTASAVPSRYRNTSAYLLELNEQTAILVDCGEGTIGQLRCLFGVDGTNEVLRRLHAVFITHAHQDHFNGLYTLIMTRERAFKSQSDVEYRPLVLALNRNVLKPFGTFSRSFYDLESLVKIVDVTTQLGQPIVARTENGRFGKEALPPGRVPQQQQQQQQQHQDVNLSPILQVVPLLPKDSFDPKEWNLKGVKAVQVHHTRMANGYVFDTLCGKRIVFSGDTKPCDLLAKEGQGADLLVHESTFEDGLEGDAERKRHSTMGQAVSVARKMGAKFTALTHFSARYAKVPVLPEYLDEIGTIGVAFDNMQLRVSDARRMNRLIPILRLIYKEEILQFSIKEMKRNLAAELDEQEKTATNEITARNGSKKQKLSFGQQR